MSLLQSDDWHKATWLATPLRLLAKAARNASVTISSQLICHDPGFPGSTLLRGSSQPIFETPVQRPNPQAIPEMNNPRTDAFNGISSGNHQQQIRAADDAEFAAYLYSQGPRALEILTVEQYRKHFNDSKAWKRRMLGYFQKSTKEDQPGNSSQVLPTQAKPGYTMLEQEVAKPRPRMKKIASPGLEEFRRDWSRVCDKYRSKNMKLPLPPPPCPPPSCPPPSCPPPQCSPPSCPPPSCPQPNYAVQVSDYNRSAREGYEDLATLNFNLYTRPDTELCKVEQNNSTRNNEPPHFVSTFSINLNSTDQNNYPTPPLSMTTSLGAPSSPVSPATPQIPIDRGPTVAPFCPPRKPINPAKLALYPPDHKLGFDCLCSSCEERRRKIKGISQIPTIRDRRMAARDYRASDTPTNHSADDISSQAEPPTGNSENLKTEMDSDNGTWQDTAESCFVLYISSPTENCLGYPTDVFDGTSDSDGGVPLYYLEKRAERAGIVKSLKKRNRDQFDGISDSDGGVPLYYPEERAGIVKSSKKRSRDQFEQGQTYMVGEDEMNLDAVENDISVKRHRTLQTRCQDHVLKDDKGFYLQPRGQHRRWSLPTRTG